MLLNKHSRARRFFVRFFFLPHLTPIAASAVLWAWMFNPDVGPINYFIRNNLGIANAPGWFRDPQWAMTGLIIMAMWGAIGGNTMLIFLAGLQGVPQELYEAASIDGAGSLGQIPQCDNSAAHTDDLLQYGLGHYRRIACLYGGLCGHGRWASLCHLVLLAAHLRRKPSNISRWATPRPWPGSSSLFCLSLRLSSSVHRGAGSIMLGRLTTNGTGSNCRESTVASPPRAAPTIRRLSANG